MVIITNYISADDSVTEIAFPTINDEDFNVNHTDGVVNYLSVACEMASR